MNASERDGLIIGGVVLAGLGAYVIDKQLQKRNTTTSPSAPSTPKVSSTPKSGTTATRVSPTSPVSPTTPASPTTSASGIPVSQYQTVEAQIASARSILAQLQQTITQNTAQISSLKTQLSQLQVS